MAGMKLILRMRKLKKDMCSSYEFVMDEIANFALSVKRKFWALVTTFVMLGLCLVVFWAVPFLFLVLVGLFCAFLAVMTPIWTLGTILNFLFVSFMLAIYEYISNFLKDTEKAFSGPENNKQLRLTHTPGLFSVILP